MTRRHATALLAGLLLATPAASQTAADAHAALARLGIASPNVSVTLISATDARYRVQTARDRVTVTASSPVAAVRGVTAALGKQGRFHASWEGNRVGTLTGLTTQDSGWVTSPFGFRAYLNTCTYGYTTPWWNWARWEREIDLMAVHGVDMPLAMEGQEFIWRALWREQGLHEAQLGQLFAGAPFLPWERMGNMAGYRAPLSSNWIEKKRVLQKQILARMRALGMTPILPAFAGYVPEAFAKAHPEARIYRMREWEGFPGTYWLDPSDPLFAKLAARFLKLYTAEYGPGRYYLADAFNEMVPPIADDGSDTAHASYGDSTANTAATRAAALPPTVRDARLAAYGKRLYASIADAQPGATWVMQGWLFGADKEFWTRDAIAAFLRDVPDQRMLILDIGNDRYPGIWKQTNGFDGKDWIYGYVHNYGGSNPIYGAPDFYRRDIAALLADPARGRVRGFGMFPEGLHNNSLAYDYAFDAAWPGGDMALGPWLDRYARARYGQSDEALVAAWRDVVAGVYDVRYWTPRWWNQRAGAYLFFKRPAADAPTYPASPGDRVKARAGIEALLGLADRHRDSTLFRYDLVDLVRHEASLALDDHLKAAVAAYQRGDVAAGDRAAARITSLARAIDRLIGGQQETLASWIADARAYGDTPTERRRFEEDAKAQVTVWGGAGHLGDYASKAWAGLYADYYLPRWTMYLSEARAAARAGRPVDDAAFLKRLHAWEMRWVADGRSYRAAAPADAVGAARAVMAQVAQP
ncbi:alpha-N-acetylglucosaminidase [Sphingomonas endophytica]|uniref:Alpha-N-acetylglucosaminidase n=1 Tax=Sphingomonas endophytica TaxID=869719 RepID=A0A7X0JCY6_9SPHN|nr:alpha-N-acetylglucosaminidase [Sphingomonas endophytica]MBB6504312.1 alpha-N-acetylglucosaminidase [Sphingomonas endophytica]